MAVNARPHTEPLYEVDEILLYFPMDSDNIQLVVIGGVNRKTDIKDPIIYPEGLFSNLENQPLLEVASYEYTEKNTGRIFPESSLKRVDIIPSLYDLLYSFIKYSEQTKLKK